MTIYLIRTKMLFVFAKEGLYCQFLSNVPLKENEAQLLHEYGLNPADLCHKEVVNVVCPMQITMAEVYEMLENKYQRVITMYDLHQTLEENFGPISHIVDGEEVVYWFNSTRIEN